MTPDTSSSPYVYSSGQQHDTATDVRHPGATVSRQGIGSEAALARARRHAAARFAYIAGAALAMLAVAAGAFGAHGLRDRVTPEMLAIFETGARYQMYHALALLGLGAAAAQGLIPRRPARWIAGLFIAGTIIFSGSLYTLVLTEVRRWGAVTPIGGVLQITAWALFVYSLWSAKRREQTDGR